MQDAKTGGSRWVPDIREDEITEFQEQNGDETATYKAVNVHPIISRILDKLAFFRTHVSAVWYNKLANKTVKDKLDEIDTSISSLNSKTGMWATNKYVVGESFSFQSVFTDLSSAGSRQNVLIFGNANGQLVNGMLMIRGNGSECAWSGIPSSISASIDSSGRVTVNLGRQAYDTFTLISGEKIAL